MNEECSSSSSSSSYWKYDVFLSFNGGDSCSDFATSLYCALSQRGIRTFRSDEAILPDDAAEAIRESRNAIVIFSENYASSPFFLQRLVQILDSFNQNGRSIWPLFYRVDPFDVCHQTGPYVTSFVQFERLFRDDPIVKCRGPALTLASSLPGWRVNPSKEPYSHEREIIQEVISRISKVVNFVPLPVAEFLVGIESRMKEVWSLLNEQPHRDGATMLGIWGIGGVGKSTLARALFNSVAIQFEHFCFLDNVGEKPIHDLQMELLSKTTGDKGSALKHDKNGAPIIKNRLRNKKVLLILDDIHSQEQLKALADEPNWFGYGSVIIITARDKHLLGSHGINRIYEVHGLNGDEARKLLIWNGFRSKEAGPEYEDVISRARDYACGLPLALEVLGSSLYGRKVHDWESALDSYERNRHGRNVYEVLKLSYDGLEEKDQEVFLDIACFYEGSKLKYATTMLQSSHGFQPESCIRALTDRSLVKIDRDGFLKMHKLIQDMGREIVRQEAPLDPGKRSRLWFADDILDVLEECTGTDQLQAIKLDFSDVKEVFCNGEAFGKMKNLKVIIIRNAKFFGVPTSLPSSLRVLDWMNYTSTTLPSNFNPRNPVMFSLPLNLKEFGSLCYLNLEHNDLLRELPEFLGAPNLKELSVSHCKNLMKVDNTSGHHANLRALQARGCTKLISFLEDGVNFPSLEILDLTGCSHFKKFPEILGEMKKIKILALSGTAIETLPESIEKLAGLECLYLYKCRRLCHMPVDSIRKLTKLERLEAGSCGISNWFKVHTMQWTVDLAFWNITRLHLNENNISDQLLVVILRLFPGLTVLELCNNNLTILPACIQECHRLKRLYLDRCRQLQEIRGIPPNIKVLSAVNCTSFSSVSSCILLSQILQVPGNRKLILPGGWVPECIHCFKTGSSVYLRFRIKFPEIAVCVVFEVKGRGSSCFEFGVRVLINDTHCFIVKTDLLDIESGHIYVFDDLSHQSQELKRELPGKEFNNAQISCSVHHKNVSSDACSYVKYIGVYVHNYESYSDDIQFENPRRTLEDMICDEDFSVYSDSREDRLYYEDSCDIGSGSNAEMGSKQRGNRWHICLCVIVSSVLLYYCVLHLLWQIHQSLGRFLSFMGYVEL